MGAAIPLRDDFDGCTLRRLARVCRDAKQTRRLLSLAVIYDGGSRSDAAHIGGVTLQIIRDWVLRFNASGPNGLKDTPKSGRPSKLDEQQRRALIEIVERGPYPSVDAVVRWRLKDLAAWILSEFGIVVDERTVSRELKNAGYRRLTARPQHPAQNEFAVEDFKKGFPAELAEIGNQLESGTPIEVWFQDEARVGQKTKITRRWAKRGTRPRAPKDQRTKSAWIFGAICPERGVGAALVLPKCNIMAMQMHLQEISSQVAPGAHAVVILDQAGWHTSGKLDIPNNITLLPLPPRSPELNPVENLWQFIRDNWLSNRVFKSYEQIIDICCRAWNRLIEQPWTIMSIGMRDWAHRF
ncbi:IS630 family transposase [Roseibium sp. TrichSKD4]|uniref:IS630 family transposase n=1 Tax=Roseibium sp. TrichSKD4 TaxID=744980 RepID=UPI000A2EE86B|nr:IS630 family transposase [Roseibium sp. TrichSKD4]